MIAQFIDKKHYSSAATGLCAALFITILGACSIEHDNHEHPELTTGEAFFNHHCAECHGEDGTGRLVSQTPANILTRRGKGGIVNYITLDINPQRKMPVFSAMPHAEASAIASYLLELQQRYEAAPLNRKKPQALMIEP